MVTNTTSTSGNVAQLAEELRSTLKTSAVLTPDSEGYAESIIRWSDAVEKRAGVVVYVGSPEDVSTTILAARKHAVSFVVAGGKHSSGGASSSEGGLVIDLGRYRKVTVDTSNNTVKVGGGCIWKDVDEAAAEYGLAMVGGTVNHTGVGGLTLGGGYGWLSGRYGLTLDNLLSVEIVLADGTITNANEKENSDLFWAVRGAGHAFGVVTEFTFQTYEQKNRVWAGQLGFSIDKLEEVVAFANKLVVTSDGDSGLVMGITAPPFTGGNPAVIATCFHNGLQASGEAFFKPLLDLQPIINTVVERPYREVNGMMNHAVDYGGRKLSKGAAFSTPIRAEFIRESILPELRRFHKEVPGGKKTILLFEFFRPDKWCQVPADATAHGHRGAHQNLMIGPFWDNAEDDMEARLWSRGVAKLAKAEFEKTRNPEDGPATEYGNYDHLEASATGVFGNNFDRLVTLKQKYDPTNVFDKSYNLRK